MENTEGRLPGKALGVGVDWVDADPGLSWSFLETA
jgi:hypothetical protein